MWVLGAVAALLIAAWAGVEIHQAITEYPAQIAVVGISSVVLTAVSLGVHVRRVLRSRVTLPPPPPRAIAPGKSHLAIAPYLNVRVPAGICEGPGCGRPHGAEPYVVEVTRPGAEPEERRFCSLACVDAWVTTDKTRRQ